MEQFDAIIDSYVYGQFEQMVKQMDKILISEFLEYADGIYGDDDLIKAVRIYFKLKGR